MERKLHALCVFQRGYIARCLLLSFLNCFFSGFVALGPEEVFLDFPCILATVIPNTQKGQKHFFRFFDTTSFFDQVLPS